MSRTLSLLWVMSFSLASLVSNTVRALEMPDIFASHMVLQRDQPIHVWGKAQPGSIVKITLAQQTQDTHADDMGKWQVTLPALSVNTQGLVMLVRADDQVRVYSDILVGEVWLCSGQSNMEWKVVNANHSREEIAAATDPMIRLCTVKRAVADKPQDQVDAIWEVCSPKTVPEFSAVGYFFGRYLRQELNVPVGLVHASWGGTPAEAWTSQQAMAANPITQAIIKRWDAILAQYANWKQTNQPQSIKKFYNQDPGNVGFEKGYAQSDFNDSAWENVRLPALLDRDYDGVAWYRRTVRLPLKMQGKTLILHFGPIDDCDVTYVNGAIVGRMNDSGAWSQSRQYTLADSMTQTGELTLAVRVFDRFSSGGFKGDASQMYLQCQSTGQSVSLSGVWKYKWEKRMSKAPGKPKKPRGPKDPHRPANLFNAMIHPLIPFGIRGAIWYQGESNVERASEYRTLLPVMINDWRTRWQQGNFPFGIVQLANFHQVQKQPGDSPWARLRDAQWQTSRTVTNTGLIVTIDLGDARNIHPANKQDVGRRLGVWAMSQVYGRKSILYCGPVLQSYKIDGDRIRLTFDHVGEGLKTIDGHVPGAWTITEDMKRWYWAKARITGCNTMEVWFDKLSHPIAARYAWADNPDNPNLTNSAMIPASPFRTDER